MTDRLSRPTRIALLCTAASVAASGLMTPAHAQNTQAQSEAEATAREDQIVITGSRIARRDYIATSPIVTVDSEILEKSASINLEANLNKLPQFSPALTQFVTQDVQVNAGNAIGASTVSLRQLGSNRNVVLVDGRRPTPVNGQNVVDINSIPSAAIERVEIISGGASSTYGADAVGGVVNFILRKNFNGVSVDAQSSITSRGDGFEYRVSGLMGTSLDSGRGAVMMGMEYYNRDSVKQALRPWYSERWADPNVAGTDVFVNDNFVSFGVTRTGITATQVQPSQAAMNTLFRSLGAPSTYTRTDTGAAVNLDIPRSVSVSINEDIGKTVSQRSLYINTTLSRSLATTGSTVGRPFTPLLVNYTGEVDGVERKIANGLGGFFTGVLQENNTDVFLSSPQERYSFFAKGNYDLNDVITLVGQVSFAKTEVRSLFNATNILGSFAATIPYGTDRYLGNSALGIASSIVDSTPTNTADDATMRIIGPAANMA
jgi:iron complex outermembrane recepter protein